MSTTLALLLTLAVQPSPDASGYARLLALHEDVLRGGEDLESLEARLAEIDPRAWERAEKVDYLLVKARLAALCFDARVMRPEARDPLVTIDRIRRLPYTDVPVADVQGFRDGLRDVEAAVESAKASLTDASQELARLAIRHLERHDGVGQGEPVRIPPPPGIIGWYRDLKARVAASQPELAPDVDRALESVVSYRDWLASRLPTLTAPAYIGLEDYAWYLRHVRLMPYTVEDLRRLSERELERAVTFLAVARHKNRGLPELEPATSKEQYDAMVAEAEGQIRALLRSESLLTIPDDTPSSFETDAFFTVRAGGKRHFWEELQYRNPLNNHIHASIPGHRFDAFLQRRVQNPIRAAYRDGVRSEGWSFYIEEMMVQAGLLDELPRAEELFYIAQLARAVRIPAELGMQSGRLTLDEAVAYMVELVPFMEEDLARYDLQIYLRRPAYGMNYTMGMIQLESLLSERALALGDRFDLGVFHDEFLSKGMIPIALIAWEMSGDDEAFAWLWEE